jgi:hypothetical protein
MSNHRVRNAIPPLYAVLIVIGFIISTTVGVVVLIAGGALSGILWSALSGTERLAGRRAGRH